MRLLRNHANDATRTYDYFVAACGSDFRAYQVLKKRRDFAISIKNALVFDFQERQDGLDPEGLRAYRSYEGLVPNTKQITCSVVDPSTCVKTLGDIDTELKNAENLALDISCFTKPYFFCILKYLKEQTTATLVTVLYTEPLSYVFSKGLYDSYHSTFGPLSVTEIPGFPGNDTRTTKKCLVLLLGFDGELSSFIAEEVSPEHIAIINGFPAYAPKFKDISLINNEKLLSTASAGSIQYARANNPFETFNLLEQLYDQEPSAFFNIAPIGTKPMALGACMFALVHPEVRIVYPLPEKYAHITTKECWNSWSYEVPLRIE